MANEQMAMPQAAAPAGMPPDQMAIFEQMREQISPQEFTNEMLASGSQVDPQAVSEFTQALSGLELPPEVLDALNTLVDTILAAPEDYAKLRQQALEAEVPEDLLPEQFDPQFFAALNMAVDQMRAEPAGVQAFAKGGIAELKPIAKAIASYGRNGDTMLAHITPAEARMLRRRGGSGTTNPDTGLPEFWNPFKAIAKAVKSIGKAISSVVKGVVKAVKSFAKSTVGKLITTVALGFFLGPAAASMLGVSSAAGVAAVSGFVGSAGSTLAAGGNLKDALKAGAVGGLTAGAGAGIMGGADAFASGSYTGATTVGGQFDKFTGGIDKFKDAIGMGNAAPGELAPVVDMGPTSQGTFGQAPTEALGQGMASTNPTEALGQGMATPGAGTPPPAMLPNQAAPTGAVQPPMSSAAPDATAFEGSLAKASAPASTSMLDTAKDFYSKNISPSGIQAAGQQDAMANVLKQFPTATAEQVMSAPASSVLGKAYSAAMPGILSTYGPMAAAGLGIMGLTGGFQAKQPQLSETAQELLNRDDGRPTIQERPDLFYLQDMPGVKYDDRGAIIGSTPWSPSATMADVRVPGKSVAGGPSSGIGLPVIPTPSLYTPGPGTMGQSRQIEQPYNNPYMYSNLMQPMRTYAQGGNVNPPVGGLASLAKGGYPRRTGQISGPGTEKSDSIPAMLSDGEFVMTAKAVRGAGKGSRRAGAKKMYDLMHQLERNASRG